MAIVFLYFWLLRPNGIDSDENLVVGELVPETMQAGAVAVCAHARALYQAGTRGEWGGGEVFVLAHNLVLLRANSQCSRI